jgi:aspartyl-tRNA(Asn)/glutamyl-tRNA(Gln) amidotransferase subunit C
MADLSKTTVIHTAKLAHLKLKKDEIAKLTAQLSEVVNYFDQLREVDTSNTLPTSQTTGLENVFREDLSDPQHCLTQEDVLSGTERAQNGYFVVPYLLEEKEA